MSSKTLAVETREDLRWVLEILNVSQGSIAHQIQGSQAWISNLLQGKRPVRERDIVWKFAVALEEIRADKINSGIIDEMHAARIGQILTDLRLTFELPASNRFSIPGGKVIPADQSYLARKVHLNGFPMPIGRATEYILNECQLPLTMAVSGLPKSGKTTVVASLEKGLQAKGVKSLTFELHQFWLEGNGNEVFKKVLTLLDRLLEVKWGLKPNEASDHSLSQPAKLSAAALSNRMLIIDGVDHLPEDAETQLVELLHQLQSQQRVEQSIPNLCIVGGEKVSLLGFANPIIEVGVLEQNEVLAFAELMGVDNILAQEVYNLFGGQIYLTHLSFEMLRSGMVSSIAELAEQLAERQGPFSSKNPNLQGLEDHLNRLRSG